MRLLIVGGHPLLREGLLALFWMSGDVNALAVGADEALRMARQFSPNIVLLDLALHGGAPSRLGESLLAEFPTVRLVYLDDEICAGNVQAAVKMKASGYWTKQTSFEQLAEAICTVASGGTAFCPGAAEFFTINESHSRDCQ
jgi:DNA-binding NarL/FixJ family response regulator